MTAQQVSLFDGPIINHTPPSSGVRRTDHDTSHQAARANRPQRASQRMRLLAVFARASHAGLTDETAGRLAGIERVADTRRCSELRQHGLIAPTGQTLPTATGSPAMVCAITDAGRKAVLAG